MPPPARAVPCRLARSARAEETRILVIALTLIGVTAKQSAGPAGGNGVRRVPYGPPMVGVSFKAHKGRAVTHRHGPHENEFIRTQTIEFPGSEESGYFAAHDPASVCSPGSHIFASDSVQFEYRLGQP